MLTRINNYCHGYVAIPVVLTCREGGLFHLLEKGPATLAEIAERLNANSGHLGVAMRMLESLEWVSAGKDGNWRLTVPSSTYQKIPEGVLELLDISTENLFRKSEKKEDRLRPWIEQSIAGWGVADADLRGMLDGLLFIPVMLNILAAGLYNNGSDRLFIENEEFILPEDLIPLFQRHEWCSRVHGNGLDLTELGRFFLERVLVCGIVASYIPMLRRMKSIIFGECASVFQLDADGHESHLDRRLNVLSSGFSHRRFFKEVEDIVLSIFNRLPFDNQPRYIADMGCGDGSLLRAVYTAIRDRSERGKVLDQYPLTMIGIDYNDKALKATEETLAGIPSLVIHGDIGDPQKMEVDLSDHIEDVSQVLHIRSFLDHDRPWLAPKDVNALERRKRIEYQGVYVTRQGQKIEPHVVVQSLVEHLQKWGGIRSKHGLIVLEVHCLPPGIVSRYLNETESLNFDAYHAFSGQFLVEAEVFIMAAAEAGLFPQLPSSRIFPQYLPYTRITLNHFERRDYRIRFADERDMEVLLKLDESCFPKAICATESVLSQRIQNYPEGQLVIEREGRILGAIYSQRIPDKKALHYTSVGDIPKLHDSKGPYLQLISLNIFPEYSDQQLGSQLLNFMLYRSSVMNGIQEVVGITRCVTYGQYGNMSYEKYLGAIFDRGWFRDPILKFHQFHGAKILGIVKNYRPADADNNGHGILIEYDVRTLEWGGKVRRESYHQEQTGESLVVSFLKKKMDFSAVDPALTLGEVGLDSLDFVELLVMMNDKGAGPLSSRDLKEMRLSDIIADDRPVSPQAVERKNPGSNIVLNLLKKKIDIDRVDPEKTLGELGLDSLDFVELLVLMGGSGAASLSAKNVNKKKLSEILRICGGDERPKRSNSTEPLTKRMGALIRDYPEMVPLSIGKDGPNTFWIHPMSGDVGVYHSVAAQSEYPFNIMGIMARGFLSSMHKPLNNVIEMAKYYSEMIVVAEPQGPYHLAGFSFGGTIAYETARQLQLQGKDVRTLILLEAPCITGQESSLFQATERENLLMNANFLLLSLLKMDRQFAKGIERGEVDWARYKISREDIDGVPGDELVDFLIEYCRNKGLKQSEESLKFKLTSMAKTHLANLEAIRTYQVTPLPLPDEVRAYLFRTEGAHATSKTLSNPVYLERIEEQAGSILPFLQPWNAVLPGLETLILRGDNHFDMINSVDGIDEFLKQCHRIYKSSSISPDLSKSGRTEANKSLLRQGIAIIGMSGRFPDAENVSDFWENLKGGRDSVTEVPIDRGWDINDYYDRNPQTPGKTYSKWGAFIAGADQFDPSFFRISPREAELMDPSERLFLQEAWKAIEDSGYAPKRLSGRRWGVFASAKGDYSKNIIKRDRTFFTATDSSAPARLSYILNLTGPAVSIDTACSSTLTAIVHACDSLSLGNCEVAIAGGGAVYVTPDILIGSSQSLLFSPDGKCFTFDERANGTVLGEAIGAVILKPLNKAIEDGDLIYGVIRGWGSNQDGKTNGMTAPSVKSQIQLETDIYQRFSIDPESIGMVEAHGTGTKLGDPIEVQALIESFRRYTSKKGYCALGSVKTNIGHAFLGAGIAGVIKVLLCLKYKQIPPTLNFRAVNPYIPIETSPFYINTTLKPWESRSGLPRCAAVSSFGATGINAHLVIEEYLQTDFVKATDECVWRDANVIVPLSARTAEQLQQKSRDLLNFIDALKQSGQPPTEPLKKAYLVSMAYTLQVGREAMEERVGFVVDSIDQLADKLQAYIAGERAVDNTFRGTVKDDKQGIGIVAQDDDMEEVVDKWMARKKLSKLAELWVRGLDLDWHKLYDDTGPQRLSLPAYPFARERYWISGSDAGHGSDRRAVMTEKFNSIEGILEKIVDGSMETNHAVSLLKVMV